MSRHRTAKDLFGSNAPAVDPGASGSIVVDRTPHVVNLVSTAAQTRTLARPTQEGALCFLHFRTDGGDITLTVTGGFNEDGDTSFTFSDAGQFAAFVSFHDGTNYFWRKFADYASSVLTPAESAFLQNVTAGTATASKAVVLGASKDIATITSATITTVTTGTVSEVVAASGVAVDSAVIRDGQFHGIQPTPTAETGAATITIADILSGIVTLTHTVGATVALTLDTGTAMDTGMPASFGTNQFIDWYLINLSAAAADTGTLTASTGHTIVGVAIVQSLHATTGGITGNSSHWRSRRTAANTWVTYRIA